MANRILRSENSLKQYITTYNFLVKKAGSESIKDIYKFIVESDVKPQTQLNYFNSLIGLKKARPEIIKADLEGIVEKRNELQTIIEKARRQDNMNGKQRETVQQISNDDIENAIDRLHSLKDVDLKSLEDYVLMRLSFPAPLRNDLMEVKVVKVKPKKSCTENVIYLPTKKGASGQLIIVEHKSSNEFKPRPLVREISPELVADIKRLVNSYGRTYLFETNTGKPYSSSSFSHKMSSLFKRNLGQSFSSTTLRKIYLTNKYSNLEKEMKKDAELMGNSVSVQKAHYIDNKI
jgi:hypothetical protein